MAEKVMDSRRKKENLLARDLGSRRMFLLTETGRCLDGGEKGAVSCGEKDEKGMSSQ